jgi:hypothetical protein
LKGVDPNTLMKFPVPGNKDERRDLYYLIESFKVHPTKAYFVS